RRKNKEKIRKNKFGADSIGGISVVFVGDGSQTSRNAVSLPGRESQVGWTPLKNGENFIKSILSY
ncbi:MAG: hypothetical protein IJY35_03650, partial [Clostridia bacterium]|nr:hypothetical protein [Clostridia bacterium]